MTRLAEPIEGIWWLPGARRRSRHGVLQQLQTGHFELTLRTAWPPDVMATIDRAEHVSLLGRDQSGRPISLLAGFLTSFSSATFHFDRIFVGAHFPNEDDAYLAELSTYIPALDHWVGISGLKSTSYARDASSLFTSLSQKISNLSSSQA